MFYYTAPVSSMLPQLGTSLPVSALGLPIGTPIALPLPVILQQLAGQLQQLAVQTQITSQPLSRIGGVSANTLVSHAPLASLINQSVSPMQAINSWSMPTAILPSVGGFAGDALSQQLALNQQALPFVVANNQQFSGLPGQCSAISSGIVGAIPVVH